MDLERAREMMLSLPHVVETMQWGDNLVFWVGDKAVGGRMFALANLDAGSDLVVSFAAGHERATDLCELEGFRPAPYLARAGWVAAERWDVLPAGEWKRHLTLAHERTYSKLTSRTRGYLALPERELGALIAERRRILAAAEPTRKVRATSARPRNIPG